MHWRRFATSSIPTHSETEFADWLLARWREKDDLLEYYLVHGEFPATEGEGGGYVETGVRPESAVRELVSIFVPMAAFALVVNVLLKVWGMVLKVLHIR